ncbi:hypothetical protein BHE74_00000361 [Ensete ventricosum]|nr:hypothetical protein GW17_00019890 [Ensete ventricosum]RWW90620.1 hypothetical protein BHE74_00000361 [Ensete ventricosum]RZR76297.1 hypothetical protein BHM03_00000968 [Ensete ventricosum]
MLLRITRKLLAMQEHTVKILFIALTVNHLLRRSSDRVRQCLIGCGIMFFLMISEKSAKLSTSICHIIYLFQVREIMLLASSRNHAAAASTPVSLDPASTTSPGGILQFYNSVTSYLLLLQQYLCLARHPWHGSWRSASKGKEESFHFFTFARAPDGLHKNLHLCGFRACRMINYKQPYPLCDKRRYANSLPSHANSDSDSGPSSHRCQ